MKSHKKTILILIGGGGFTSETIPLLTEIRKENKLVFVISGGNHFDHISYEKILKCNFDDSHILTITNPAQMIMSFPERILSYVSNIIETIIISNSRKYDLCLGVGTFLSLFFFIVSTLKRKPCIFVETITRADKLSNTGKIIYFLRLADKFYVYHKNLVFKYNKVTYAGIK